MSCENSPAKNWRSPMPITTFNPITKEYGYSLGQNGAFNKLIHSSKTNEKYNPRPKQPQKIVFDSQSEALPQAAK